MATIEARCRLCEVSGSHQLWVAKEMMMGTREEFNYFTCSSCGTLQICECPPGPLMSQYYGPGYYSYNVSRLGAVLSFFKKQRDRAHFKFPSFGGRLIAAFKPEPVFQILSVLGLRKTSRILDVGCGSGNLLDRLASIGFVNLSGMDPFIDCDMKTQHGVPIKKREIYEDGAKFDLIMFNHSLEHMEDPKKALKIAHNLLDDGGQCLVRIPTSSSEAWEIYGASWVQLDAPRHFVLASRQGIEQAAKEVGLKLISMIDDSHHFQFVGSEQYLRDIPLNDIRGATLFSRKQVSDFKRRSVELNRINRGDQSAFLFERI